MYEIKPEFRGLSIAVKGFGPVTESTAKHPKIAELIKAFPILLNYLSEVKQAKEAK